MHNFKQLFILSTLCLACNLSASVQLFTITSIPFADTTDPVCYLDSGKNSIDEINKLIQVAASDDDIAKILNPKVLQDINDNTLCRFNAANIGIDKVPAIVIDDSYIVYGVRDVKTAEKIIRRAKNG